MRDRMHPSRQATLKEEVDGLKNIEMRRNTNNEYDHTLNQSKNKEFNSNSDLNEECPDEQPVDLNDRKMTNVERLQQLHQKKNDIYHNSKRKKSTAHEKVESLQRDIDNLKHKLVSKKANQLKKEIKELKSQIN